MQPSASSLDEYNKYIASPPVIPIPGMTSRKWWIRPAQRELYPSLSLMAIDLLSIPASSSETERLFSGAWQTITATRGALQEPAINALECLKSWFKVDGKDREGVENACRDEDAKEAVQKAKEIEEADLAQALAASLEPESSQNSDIIDG